MSEWKFLAAVSNHHILCSPPEGALVCNNCPIASTLLGPGSRRGRPLGCSNHELYSILQYREKGDGTFEFRFAGKNDPTLVAKCECGEESLEKNGMSGGLHSDWCPKYKGFSREY